MKKWLCAAVGSIIIALFSIGANANELEPCSPGYSRVMGSFCKKTIPSLDNWVDQAGCTKRWADGAPAGSIAVVWLQWAALSANTVGDRQNYIRFYESPGCEGGVTQESWMYAREFVAITAGRVFQSYTPTHLVVVSSDGFLYTMQRNNGGNGNADVQLYSIIGYYDK
jgi:hypothetical protein